MSTRQLIIIVFFAILVIFAWAQHQVNETRQIITESTQVLTDSIASKNGQIRQHQLIIKQQHTALHRKDSIIMQQRESMEDYQNLIQSYEEKMHKFDNMLDRLERSSIPNRYRAEDPR